MIFQSPKALKHLLKTGEVYSFRVHRRKSRRKNDWVTDKRGGKKICDVKVEYRGKVGWVGDLVSRVKESGFNSIEEWVDEIKRLNPKDVAVQADIICGYLYHVKKKEEKKK